MEINKAVTDALKQVIDQFGFDYLYQPSKFTAAFKDIEPKLRKEKRLLEMVLQTDIVTFLSESKQANSREIKRHLDSVSQEIVRQFFVDEYSIGLMINNLTHVIRPGTYLDLEGKKVYSRVDVIGNNIKIPTYKFKGKTFTDLVALLTALANSWDEGKNELYSGKLVQGLNISTDKSLVYRVRRAYETIRQTRNVQSTVADAVFCKFLYDGVGPSQLIWCGQVYMSIDDLVRSMFIWLRSEDIHTIDNGIDVFGALLEMNIISSYLRNTSGVSAELIEKIENIEKDYLYANSDQMKMELQAKCGLELLGEKYYYQGQYISSPEEMIPIVIRFANGDFKSFDRIANGIIDNGSVDLVFSTWLKLLGYERVLRKILP